MYIDDRWLYDQEDDLPPVKELDLTSQGPKCLSEGTEITIVGSGHATLLALQAANILEEQGVSVEVIDLRVLNPFDASVIITSVSKTKRLLVVDSGWQTAGFSAEVIASVLENIEPSTLLKAPKRITLPDAPAPTSCVLEDKYYTTVDDVSSAVKRLIS